MHDLASIGERSLVFKLAMRGYDRQQVDEYLVRLADDPDLPIPDFALVMRGYDTDEVKRCLEQQAST